MPATTLQEFVAYAKANPGKLNFGFGQGTLPQLVGEMFKHATGAQIANIPYKGGAQAVTDMLGGRVQMNIGTISTLAPLVREGKLRALAVTSAERNPELPDVPTMAEGGLPEVASVTYYGLFAPGGTPDGAVRRINAAVNESLKAADIAAAIRRIGFEPHGGAPEDFAKLHHRRDEGLGSDRAEDRIPDELTRRALDPSYASRASPTCGGSIASLTRTSG